MAALHKIPKIHTAGKSSVEEAGNSPWWLWESQGCELACLEQPRAPGVAKLALGQRVNGTTLLRQTQGLPLPPSSNIPAGKALENPPGSPGALQVGTTTPRIFRLLLGAAPLGLE